MKQSHHHLRLLAATAPALAGLWALAWLAGLFWIDGQGLPVRAGLAVGGLVLGAGAVLAGRARLRSGRLAVERHFDALCRLDPENLDRNNTLDQVSRLPARSPWQALAGRVRQRLAEQCREIEDLKHSQTALEIRARRASAQSELIKSILSGLDDPILAIDDFDELMLANPAAESLFDFRAEETERRAVAQLVGCEKLVDLLTSTSHRQSSTNRTDEIELVDDQGNSQWFRVSATKLADGSEQSQRPTPGGGAVAVLREIGQHKALQKRNAEFVSSVSHEMKTPLAGIKAYVELLVDGDAEDEQTREEFLDVINGQADRLQRLVDNLLNLARIEAGVVRVNKQSRSLNELLEEALEVVRPAAEAKGIELVAGLSPMYLGVLADRDTLLQAAINLLSNAVKYTPDGGRVTMRSRLVDETVTFEVEDTGVGLGPDDCERIFEKFYRVNKDKNMAAGTGLGLPLAKHIVEDVHGGRLTVQSTVGSGSTFTVSLPKSGQVT